MRVNAARNLACLVLVVPAALVLAQGGPVTLDYRTAADAAPINVTIPDVLPAVARGPMQEFPGGTESTSVLAFDDGTCESGLGPSAQQSSLVDFDVPAQCTTGGLDIIAMTARMNSGSASAAVMHQAGATPGPVNSPDVSVPVSVGPLGPCPANSFNAAVAIGPGAMVITGTANFFAGLRNTGFPGRDTTTPQGRMWALCATCGMTQYSPAFWAGAGLDGNWMIRVTVEDAQCPVELMGFDVE